jgi:hypothetical protein
MCHKNNQDESESQLALHRFLRKDRLIAKEAFPDTGSQRESSGNPWMRQADKRLIEKKMKLQQPAGEARLAVAGFIR